MDQSDIRNLKEGATEQAGARSLLEQAARSCQLDWIPISSEALLVIQRKIAAGTYETDKFALLEDLKADLGLYTYCLRTLRQVEGEEEILADKTPAERILQLDTEALKTLFMVEPSQISPHGLETMGRSQAQSLRFTLTSSTVAELFAENTGVDSELTYTCATLRQLGTILIAFNYPGVYKRAVIESTDSGRSISAVIESHLGFTPQDLGLKIVEAWELGEEIVQALSDEADSLAPQSADQPSLVRRYCQVGEALARVNDPRTYPAAVEEWQEVVYEINCVLGLNGVSLINQRVRERARIYCEALPDVFAKEVDPTKSAEIAHHCHWNSMLEKNEYLKLCPDEIQSQFRHAYQHLKAGQISPVALNMITTTILPSIGFARGCVYVYDREADRLVPKLRIGLAAFDRYAPVSRDAGGALGRAISAALDTTRPIVQEDVQLHNDLISHITWRMDDQKKTSVLHLEVGKSLRTAGRKDLLALFNASRRAILHCLNLEH